MKTQMDEFWDEDAALEVVVEYERWSDLPFEDLCETAFHATLAYLTLDAGAFGATIMGCDDAQIADLNADFRQKQTATNVLSWPSAERGAQVVGDRPSAPDVDMPNLGDIAIAYETCAAEANSAGIRFEDHVTHLIIHAILHLLGYDHIENADAELMEGIETAVLSQLGIADPYENSLD